MTIQPVETEQQFLGNDPASEPCPTCSGPIRETVNLVCQTCGHDFSDEAAADHGVLPVAPAGVYVPDSASLPGLPLTEAQLAVLAKARQHYVPNAHLRRPAWSPIDDVELTALVRKSINANKLLAIAKAKSVKAEQELQLALAVEDAAAEAVQEADRYLIAFTRKDTGL